MKKKEVNIKKKLGLFSKLFLIICGLLVLIYCYMHYIEPKIFQVKEYAIVDSNIPKSFNGLKLLHFSDIHFGRTTNEPELNRIVKEINLLKPDILVFTGDLFDEYINLSDNNKVYLKKVLKEINASIGKYAILGDNDYLDKDLYFEIMNEANFKVLDNKNIPIYYHGSTPIYLGGVSSITKGEYDLGKSLTKEEANSYQILLTHEPIIFDEIASKTNLVLAGHSLGGLIRLPYLGALFPFDNTKNYQSGKYSKLQSTMYVSNGIGTENISLRLFNIPSINLYRFYTK